MTGMNPETSIGKLTQTVVQQTSAKDFIVYWTFFHDERTCYDLLLRLEVRSDKKSKDIKISVNSIDEDDLDDIMKSQVRDCESREGGELE